MKYYIYFTGLASTPNEIGLFCLTTNEVICRISTSRETGKDTRKAFQKYKKILNNKFKSIL